MRKKRQPESDEAHANRLEKSAQDRREHGSAEDEALDAAVKRSIKHFGA